MRAVLESIWRPIYTRFVAFAVYLLMITLMLPSAQQLIAQEMRISLVLAERVALFTGSLYLGIYLLGEITRALVFTRQYQDAVVMSALLVGAMARSYTIALGLILIVSIAAEAWRHLQGRAASETAATSGQ